jgi:hypothetical protein
MKTSKELPWRLPKLSHMHFIGSLLSRIRHFGKIDVSLVRIWMEHVVVID